MESLREKVKKYIDKKIEDFRLYNPHYEETSPYIDPDDFLDFILDVEYLLNFSNSR